LKSWSLVIRLLISGWLHVKGFAAGAGTR